VYSNFDSFGPPKMAFTGREEFKFDPPTLPVQTVDIRKPLFSVDVDTLVTGSIPAGTDDDGEAEPLSPAAKVDRKRFLKSSSEFKLVFVTRGHALIQDDGELIFVSPGGTLPDGSKVRSISKAGGHWELMTSQSRTLRWQK